MKGTLKEQELFKIFTENCRSRNGYMNNYLLTDLLPIIYSQRLFSSQTVKLFWESYLSGRYKEPINFYLHVPYCYKKCAYCICRSTKLQKKEELRSYLANIIDSFEYYKNTFSGVQFENLYIGGGTPSILAESQLDYLCGHLFSAFKFKASGEKTFEMNPFNTTYRKLELLKKHGFNRVSFGIQTFSAKVLGLNSRNYQTKWGVKKAVSLAQAVGFSHINVDLILGLYGDNPGSFVQSFKQAALLSPDTICVYPLQPKRDYIDKFFNADINLFHAYSKMLFFKVMPRIKRIAKESGFLVPKIWMRNISTASPWIFIRNNSTRLSQRYSFDNLKNTSLFGLGVYSHSYIYRSIQYHSLHSHSGSSQNIFQGNIVSRKMEMIHYLLRVFSYRRWVSKHDFRVNFSVSFTKAFSGAIKKLKELKAIRISKTDKVYLLSGNTKERFMHALFFFEKNRVIESMNRPLTDNILKIILDGYLLEFRVEFALKREYCLTCSRIYSLRLLNNIPKGNKPINNFLKELKYIFKSVCCKNKYIPAEVIKIKLKNKIVELAPVLEKRIGYHFEVF